MFGDFINKLSLKAGVIANSVFATMLASNSFQLSKTYSLFRFKNRTYCATNLLSSISKQCLSPFQVRHFTKTLPAMSLIEKFKGIYVPIVTPFTSLRADGFSQDVDYDALVFNIKKLCKTSIRGIVMFGSTGEFVLLSRTEKLKAVELAHEAMKEFPQKLLIVGTGCESTQETIELSNDVAKFNPAAVMVYTPSYFKGSMTDAVLANHFKIVASNVKVPVMLYSVAGNTGIDMSVAAIGKVSDHDNIIGMKDSTGDVFKVTEITQLFDQCKEKKPLLVGSGSLLYSAIVNGAKGGICGVCNVIPEECCRLFEMLEKPTKSKQDDETIRQLQFKIHQANMIVKRNGICAVKDGMRLRGYQPGMPKLPLRPCNDTVVKEWQELLDSFK